MQIYKGGIGQWTFVMHRLTGVGVLVFLLIHVSEMGLLLLGPEIYNATMEIYRKPVFKVMEIFLVAAVLFHALNGIRIVIFDFWVDMMKYQKQLFYIEMVLFVGAMIYVTIIMLGHM